ncbi:MAG: helix-turn-helix domain-containing protein [Clostridia bacterium]|nr:helix-turn-helix domain-containing protein [Clostridia bacterium]
MGPIFYEDNPNDQQDDVILAPICDHPFPMHVHDAVEIVCPVAGSLDMTIGGEKQRIMAGDIAVAFPTVPHSYDYVSPDVQGLTLIFVPSAIQEFHNTFRTTVPRTPLMTRKQKAAELTVLIRKIMAIKPEQMKQVRGGFLHLFLAYFLPGLALRPVNKQVELGLSYQVFHYISQHYTEPLSLESTAHALGISRIHLSHIFSQQLKINFRQYINTLRIDRACQLLQDPTHSISEIAYLCGYGNPRTFHRAFLAQCNMPPKQYRARLNVHSALDDDDDEQ